jgi:hypothetical protein
MDETLWKNNLKFMKDVTMSKLDFFVVANMWEKNKTIIFVPSFLLKDWVEGI